MEYIKHLHRPECVKHNNSFGRKHKTAWTDLALSISWFNDQSESCKNFFCFRPFLIFYDIILQFRPNVRRWPTRWWTWRLTRLLKRLPTSWWTWRNFYQISTFDPIFDQTWNTWRVLLEKPIEMFWLKFVTEALCLWQTQTQTDSMSIELHCPALQLGVGGFEILKVGAQRASWLLVSS